MHAFTGYWSVPRFVAEEQAKLAEMRRTARRRHRSLDRRERMLKDLLMMDEKLQQVMKLEKHEMHYRRVRGKYTVRMRTLLRRRNRLVDALNAFVGESQKVALEQV